MGGEIHTNENRLEMRPRDTSRAAKVEGSISYYLPTPASPTERLLTHHGYAADAGAEVDSAPPLIGFRHCC